MNTQKTLGKGLMVGGIVLALIFSVWALNRAGQAVVNTVAPSFGAVTTLDGVDSPYTSIGGMKTYYKTDNLNATSSVICSKLNPYNATSTVLNASLYITGGVVPAQSVTLSTSSSAVGSSTPAFVDLATIGGNKTPAFIWTPNASTTNAVPGRYFNTNPTGESNFILGPGEYLNWRIATVTPALAGNYYTGTCSVTIRKL